jgi:hypothetical protein
MPRAVALRQEAPAPGVEIARLAEHVRPVALADQQVLPLLDALRPLVPWQGLARGISVRCEGVGATSLALATVAAASDAGAWVAAVGFPRLGLAAASRLGVSLARLLLVDEPPGAEPWNPERWAQVLGALAGAVDLVLVGGAVRVRRSDARRLQARARERGTTIVSVGADGAADGTPDLVLDATSASWTGIGAGHGHLRARQVCVQATGRRLPRPRTATLWLTGPEGQVAPVEPTASVTPFRNRQGVAVR